MTDFSVKRILKELDGERLKKVLEFFGVDKKIEAENAEMSLILTQHVANLGIMPLEKQHLLYRLLADYFLENTYIAIKAHPDDIAGRYDEIFSGEAAILPFAMPSELLPYCIGSKIKTAIAANSTAVKSLSDICERTVCFDNRILSDFEDIHRYYCVIEIIRTLTISGKALTTADELMLNELAKAFNVGAQFERTEELPTDCKIAVISDEIAEKYAYGQIYSFLQDIDANSAVLFLNEKNKYAFFDGEHTDIFRHTRPVFINLKFSNETVEQTVYIYSKNNEIINGVDNLKMQKELRYTGVTIDLHSLSSDEREKIKLLEGILNATQERLKEYIENKKELDRKIEDLSKRMKK